LGYPLSALRGLKDPFRYAPSEWGVPPLKEEARLRWCLLFPDVYEVGMSYLGFSILYWLLKSLPGVDVERAYAPWPDAEELLRRRGWPLLSVEGKRPLLEFDVVGVTLQHEMNYTNVLASLDLGGIPVLSSRRDERHPLVVAGGPGALHPEPMADFFDAFLLGDGEELLPEVSQLLLEHRPKGTDRGELLGMLSRLEGVYVPALGRRRVRRRVVADLDGAFYPDRLIVPSSPIVHDRVSVEVFRGCSRGCRFCLAGFTTRPVRERSAGRVVEISRRLLSSTGWEELGFLSLSSCDYSSLMEVLDELSPSLREMGVRVSLPSLRVDAFSLELARRLDLGRKGSLTFAPEGGTERIRDVMNKQVTDEEIRRADRGVFASGFERLKLYFMVGVPTETESDLEGIVEIAREASRAARAFGGRRSVSLSLATLVPKPHTPFQWAEALSPEESRERLLRVKRALSGLRNVQVSYHDPRLSYLEGVLCRGDREVGRAILQAYRLGARMEAWEDRFDAGIWDRAFELAGVDPLAYARGRGLDEPLPWDFVDVGVDRAFLEREWRKALEGRTTPRCGPLSCGGCGVLVCPYRRSSLP